MMLIGARAIFCAGHSLPQHKEVHGHSYEVWVWAPEGSCVEELQDRLKYVVAGLDHKMLNDLLPSPTMEEIARYVMQCMPSAVRVAVSRPLEGLSSEWTA